MSYQCRHITMPYIFWWVRNCPRRLIKIDIYAWQLLWSAINCIKLCPYLCPCCALVLGSHCRLCSAWSSLYLSPWNIKWLLLYSLMYVYKLHTNGISLSTHSHALISNSFNYHNTNITNKIGNNIHNKIQNKIGDKINT